MRGARRGWRRLGAVLALGSAESASAIGAAPAPGAGAARALAAPIDQRAFWREAFGLDLVSGEGGLVLEPTERASEWLLGAITTRDGQPPLARTTYVEIDRTAVPIAAERPGAAVLLTVGTVEMADRTWRPVTMLLLAAAGEDPAIPGSLLVAPLASHRDEGDARGAIESCLALLAPARSPSGRDRCRDLWGPIVRGCLVSSSRRDEDHAAAARLTVLAGCVVLGLTELSACLGESWPQSDAAPGPRAPFRVEDGPDGLVVLPRAAYADVFRVPTREESP